MKGVAIVVLLAGCFSKPAPPNVDPLDSSCAPSQPSAAGLEPDLGIDPVVRFPGNIQLGFASDAVSYPMPNSLRINGQQLIAMPAGCNVEDQVGIAVFPAYSISGNDTPPASSAKVLDRLISGPAYTLLQTNWQYHSTNCSDLPTFGEGNTQWAMFPDGRVVRNDFLQPTTTQPIMAARVGCACSGNPPYFVVTSYTAFDNGALTSVTSGTQTAEATSAPIVGSPPPPPSDRGCVRASGNGRVALRWDLVFEDEPTTPPTRIRTVAASGNEETVFVYDMVPDGSQATLSNVAPYGVRTHMLLDGSGTRDCIEMTRDVNAYPGINPLRIDGALVSYSSQGIFDDFAITGREHTEPVVVAAQQGTVGAGFVVAVKFPGFTAIRTSAQSTGVVWQHRASDDMFFVFFPESLVGDDSITITPEC